MKARIFMLGLGAVLTLASVAGAETAIKFKYKDVIAPGSVETDTYGINNKGWIAGDYVDANFEQHGMLIKKQNVKTIDKANCPTAPGTTGIQFFGVNVNNDAVGWCTDTNGFQVAFKWSAGSFTNIKIKGALAVNANGINDKGNIVGTYIDANGAQHGYLLVGTKLTKLDPPGVVALATAFGINNNNVITIYGQDVNGTYLSFTTKDKGKTYKPFHVPDEGPVGTAIHHINGNGDITATYFDADSNRHGVLQRNGKQTILDDPDGVGSTRGNGINDSLNIVGRYAPADGDPPDQGYLAIPK
jgi:hypothetical protein